MTVEGKTILITGSTDGVGRHVALRLAAGGAHVLVHGRSRERGEGVVDAVRSRGAGAASFYPADLASLAETRRLAAAVRQDHPRIDVLVNNAGIGFGAGRRELSQDGYELRFAVNYLAVFLLTRLLLPTLRASTPARIVNVASAGQQPIDFDDPLLERAYDGVRAYRRSKLAQIMFTFDLARELEGTGVTANCLHPATFMATTMVREAGIAPMSTVEEGGDAIYRLAASPALEGKSGLYFDGVRPAHALPQATDATARERLRALSFRLTGLDDRDSPERGAAR